MCFYNTDGKVFSKIKNQNQQISNKNLLNRWFIYYLLYIAEISLCNLFSWSKQNIKLKWISRETLKIVGILWKKIVK